MKSFIEILNQFPALRLVVLVATLCAVVFGAAWKLSESLHEIKSSLNHLAREGSQQSEHLARLEAKVERNTQFRIRAEATQRPHPPTWTE